jgi:hypothetical protein
VGGPFAFWLSRIDVADRSSVIHDQITPEMEQAGIWALPTAGIGLLCAEDWEVRDVAHEVYLAMRLADPASYSAIGAGSKNVAPERDLSLIAKAAHQGPAEHHSRWGYDARGYDEHRDQDQEVGLRHLVIQR